MANHSVRRWILRHLNVLSVSHAVTVSHVAWRLDERNLERMGLYLTSGLAVAITLHASQHPSGPRRVTTQFPHASPPDAPRIAHNRPTHASHSASAASAVCYASNSHRHLPHLLIRSPRRATVSGGTTSFSTAPSDAQRRLSISGGVSGARRAERARHQRPGRVCGTLPRPETVRMLVDALRWRGRPRGTPRRARPAVVARPVERAAALSRCPCRSPASSGARRTDCVAGKTRRALMVAFVTLTGPVASGKRACARSRGHVSIVRRGVVFVDLSPLTDPDSRPSYHRRRARRSRGRQYSPYAKRSPASCAESGSCSSSTIASGSSLPRPISPRCLAASPGLAVLATSGSRCMCAASVSSRCSLCRCPQLIICRRSTELAQSPPCALRRARHS